MELEAKIEIYKKEVEELSNRCYKFRKFHEKYIAIKEFISLQEKEESSDPVLLSNSTDELIIDINYPEIKIRRYQYDTLRKKIKYGEAVRHLLDCLFEQEELKNKSYLCLKKEESSKINVIEQYVTANYNCTISQIHKVITDKTCRIK